MKVRAFVFNKLTNEYLSGPLGNHIRVHAEEAAKLKKEYPHVHNQREYRNTRADPQKRQRLKLVTKNETSFFSYIGEHNQVSSEGSDESESHHAAVVALSRLTTMNFHSPDSKLPLAPFHFTEVRIEPSLVLANGRTYVPDLLCLFDEEHPLYDRWGGKLAIEVTYAHPCEDTKIHDFMFHNIPILELVIDKGSSREYPGERYKWDYYSQDSIEKHTNNLESWFKEFISINVLVDPISNRVHEEITSQLFEKINKLNFHNKSVSEALVQSQKKQSLLLDEISNLESKSSRTTQEHIEEKEEQRRQHNLKIEQLLEQNLVEKRRCEELKEALEHMSSQASILITFSIILVVLILGSLLAPAFFMDSTVKVLVWYLRIFS